jgi:hypothetical protein
MQLVEAVAKMARNLPVQQTLVRVEETRFRSQVQRRSLQPLQGMQVLQHHLLAHRSLLQVVAVVESVPILRLMLHSVALQAAAEVEAAVRITPKMLVSTQASPAQMVSAVAAVAAVHVMAAEQME